MKSLLNALQEGRLVELPDSDKEKALIYLAHLIEAIPDLSVGVDVVEAMLARERSANTGLGHGVACPHVRSSGAGELLCAVGWSPSGVEYGAPDGQKVHLLVMFFIPDAQKNVYLKEVSALAGAIMRGGGIAPIAAAKDLATVREQLLDWVSAAIEAGVPEAKARMIRLEARQAAVEAPPVVLDTKAPLQLVGVLFLEQGGAKTVVLTQNADLAAGLEKAQGLDEAIRARGNFESAGFRLIHRGSVPYEGGRTLHDYLALKAA